MPIPSAEAQALLDTFANVSGNARARARDRILALLTASAPADWQAERDAMQATIDRQRAADERSMTMLAECRKMLADMTIARDAAIATLRDQQQASAAKVPKR